MVSVSKLMIVWAAGDSDSPEIKERKVAQTFTHRHSNMLRGGERALLHSFNGEWKKLVTSALVDKAAFAEGSMRLALRGQVLIDGIPLDAVFKFSKLADCARTSYFKDVEMQFLCGQWAAFYTQFDPAPPLPLEFVPSYVLVWVHVSNAV